HIIDDNIPKKTILAIGETGTGKSTFGLKVFNVDTVPGSGISSVTRISEIFENLFFRYIDTPGFSDSEGLDDDEVFIDMLSLIQENSVNNKFKIDLILWFCFESRRCNQQLQRGAKFIQKLSDYSDLLNNEDLNIWNNVLIIIQGQALDDATVEGPQAAARLAWLSFIKEKNILFNIDDFKLRYFPCFVYNFQDIPSPYMNMSQSQRQSLNVYSNSEIISKMQQLVSEISSKFNGFNVCFKSAKCSRCDQKGDPRLFKNKCHFDFKHNLSTKLVHSNVIEGYHIGPIVCVHSDKFHQDQTKVNVSMATGGAIGGAIGGTVGSILALAGQKNAASSGVIGSMTGIVGATAGKIVGELITAYECSECGSNWTKPGCIKKCSNCDKLWDSYANNCGKRYSCCKKSDDDSGCTLISYCVSDNCNTNLSGCICIVCNQSRRTTGCHQGNQHDIIYFND
ncbi:1392_t:CDS:1, partial [Dentiscutata erythropus]